VCSGAVSLPVEAALERASGLCAARGVRFTTLRQRVFALVCEAERPVGAYDLLERLADADDRRAQPPTVYRALDFLQSQGLIHRLASNNTYLACVHPEEGHASVFLVCRHCGRASELESAAVDAAIGELAGQSGFSVEHSVMELAGLCELCRGHRHRPASAGAGA